MNGKNGVHKLGRTDAVASRTPRTGASLLQGTIIAVLFWGEWLSYMMYSHLNWPALGKADVKILIVADPQLLGYENEPWWIGWLTRWDSDRYISRGYNMAKSYSEPDGVIFLGDLFDEGVEETDSQFSWTLERFSQIFLQEELTKLFIAGDNDIGGEMEPVYSHLKERFNKTFPNLILPTNDKWKDFSIYETNYFESPMIMRAVLRGRDITNLNILLSHMPISPGISLQGKEIHKVPPDLVLSAHEHNAWHFITMKDGSMRSVELTTRNPQTTGGMGNNHPVSELQSPTCSYRMGTTTIGYGILYLKKISDVEYSFTYSVLWLPNRFIQISMLCIANLVLAALCPLCYVGLVLIFDYNGTNRNAVNSVKRRLLAAFVTSAISLTITYRQLGGNLEAMGLRTHKFIIAAILPTIAILILYLGQICLFIVDGQLSHYTSILAWKRSFNDICWIRDIIVAPITEEIVYRACTASLVATCFSKWQTVFIAPLFFGLSHLHHILNDLKNGYNLSQAIIHRSFQFTYTYFFGAYATYLLLSTKHIIAPILTHCVCNSFGLPLFGEIEKFGSRKTSIFLWSMYIIGIVGFVFTVGSLTDSSFY